MSDSEFVLAPEVKILQARIGGLRFVVAGREQALLGLILTLALALRIVAVCIAPTWYSADSVTYHNMGLAILDGEPISRMPNGLPLLEAAMQALLGERSILGILGINILASVAACGLVYAIAKQLFGSKTAWVALAIMAIYPHSLNYVRFELTETLSLTLLLAVVWAILRHRYAGAGLLLGLAWLCRTSVTPLAALLILLLLMLPYAQVRWRAAGAFFMGFAAIWLLHLGLVIGGVVRSPINLGENLLWAITATSTEGIPFEQGNDPVALQAPWSAYFTFALEHPGTWMAQRLSSLWELMGPWPSPGNGLAARGILSRLVIGMRFGLLLMALWAAWRRPDRHTLLLLAAPIALAALHFFFFSEPRFWVPCEPFLMILAARSWVDIKPWLKEKWRLLRGRPSTRQA